MSPSLSRRSLLALAAAGTAAACAGPAATKPGAAASPTRPAGPASPVPAPTGPAVEVSSGSRSRREVALTFHGAGEPSMATELLGEAERGGARVTVFAIGSWLAANPQLTQRILGPGHALANHTYTHPSNFRTLTTSGMDAEIIKARDVLVDQEGTNGRYFRPSAMDHTTPMVLERAGAAGYRTVVSFDVDPADYTDPGSAAVVERTLAKVRPGSIVSLHLGHRGTITALPQILSGFASRGLSAVTVDTLLRA